MNEKYFVSPNEKIRLGSIVKGKKGQVAIRVKGGVRGKRYDDVYLQDILRSMYGDDGNYTVIKENNHIISLIEADKPTD